MVYDHAQKPFKLYTFMVGLVSVTYIVVSFFLSLSFGRRIKLKLFVVHMFIQNKYTWSIAEKHLKKSDVHAIPPSSSTVS